eukprot:scaffold59841_cov15-Prasinocladus_malaysianus.AAC.1
MPGAGKCQCIILLVYANCLCLNATVADFRFCTDCRSKLSPWAWIGRFNSGTYVTRLPCKSSTRLMRTCVLLWPPTTFATSWPLAAQTG